MRRQRNCAECGKALGGTVGTCHECGGEKPSPSKEERLRDARTWKILLGVDPLLIKSAHEEVTEE